MAVAGRLCYLPAPYNPIRDFPIKLDRKEPWLFNCAAILISPKGREHDSELHSLIQQ